MLNIILHYNRHLSIFQVYIIGPIVYYYTHAEDSRDEMNKNEAKQGIAPLKGAAHLIFYQVDPVVVAHYRLSC